MRSCQFWETAERFGVTVVCSASLLQGRLLGQLPDTLRDQFDGLTTDAQRCLQFVRSTPGVTTALVGMGRARAHHGKPDRCPAVAINRRAIQIAVCVMNANA